MGSGATHPTSCCGCQGHRWGHHRPPCVGTPAPHRGGGSGRAGGEAPGRAAWRRLRDYHLLTEAGWLPSLPARNFPIRRRRPAPLLGFGPRESHGVPPGGARLPMGEGPVRSEWRITFGFVAGPAGQGLRACVCSSDSLVKQNSSPGLCPGPGSAPTTPATGRPLLGPPLPPHSPPPASPAPAGPALLG